MPGSWTWPRYSLQAILTRATLMEPCLPLYLLPFLFIPWYTQSALFLWPPPPGKTAAVSIAGDTSYFLCSLESLPPAMGLQGSLQATVSPVTLGVWERFFLQLPAYSATHLHCLLPLPLPYPIPSLVESGLLLLSELIEAYSDKPY